MKRIWSLLKEDFHKNLLSSFNDRNLVSVSGAGNVTSKVFIVNDIIQHFSLIKKIVWVVNDYSEQENLVKTLRLLGEFKVFSFEIPEEISQNDSSLSIKKEKNLYMSLISHFLSDEKEVIVIKYRDLLKQVPSKETVDKFTLSLSAKDKRYRVDDVFESLISTGYEVSDDQYLKEGTYLRHGGNLDIYAINYQFPLRIEAEFDHLGEMMLYKDQERTQLKPISEASILPLNLEPEGCFLFNFIKSNSLIVEDELEILEEYYPLWSELQDKLTNEVKKLSITPFYEDTPYHVNLHYVSVIGYPTVFDLINDLREKRNLHWNIVIFTKNFIELSALFKEKELPFTTSLKEDESNFLPLLLEVSQDEPMPHAFQSPKYKFIFITDREIDSFKEKHRRMADLSHKVYLDLLTSLKVGDYVVHSDHGIALFQGLEKKTVDALTREYLKLGYAENDKLFVPIDQADKVNKFIGTGDTEPRLTRLGSAEWNTIQSRIRKETEKIANELLHLYAARELAKGHAFKPDTKDQELFEATFPYEETPGQIKAIVDVKQDMEKAKTMDRLVCGDVGFGKTEVAMRAAFKAVKNGKQVAFISPITILADQHYRSFQKRMDSFHIRVDMLSRFKTDREQTEILGRLKKGELDIVIGTHRLLQEDVVFKDLGLVIIDEEQRFGVKQKEKFKSMRAEVDILTLTATPIPRTLNIALNKLRDISTITTPPRGRLPVIVEVRRYSSELIREVILRELERSGQIYFLHNRVQTIDSVASQLKTLIPEARFVVAHGKLGSGDLERRIIDFKDHKYDVLVSSTIIENGIDLPNANTLIVNNAEKFGLAQLYQLRGRVGRGDKQAYAYFLYKSQRLKYDAKKRLRSIVEATELGSGFQIAMKDLEIRGAGDILGANQHGAINVVGVSHYLRMLNQAVEDLRTGNKTETEEPMDVSIELPVTAFIPDYYIASSNEKIQVYQKLSSADTFEYLNEIREELVEDYGRIPKEVNNLFKVIELKILAKKAGLINLKAENIHDPNERLILLHMSDKVKPENVFNLLEYNGKWLISGTKLKIKSKDLGVHWFDELKECVKRLGDVYGFDRGSLKSKMAITG